MCGKAGLKSPAHLPEYFFQGGKSDVAKKVVKLKCNLLELGKSAVLFLTLVRFAIHQNQNGGKTK